MTARTSNRTLDVRGTIYEDFDALNNTIYAGTLNCTNSSGILVNGTDSAGLEFAGVSKEIKDSNNKVRIYKSGIFNFEHASLVQANINKDVWLLDNQTVTNFAGVSNNIHVGVLVGLENSQAQILINVKAQNSQSYIANPTRTAGSPSGGAVIDSEARAEIDKVLTDIDLLITKMNAILDIFETQGTMKPS